MSDGVVHSLHHLLLPLSSSLSCPVVNMIDIHRPVEHLWPHPPHEQGVLRLAGQAHYLRLARGLDISPHGHVGRWDALVLFSESSYPECVLGVRL